MATSDVEIVNMGLVMIGEEPITALTDNSAPARAANLFYARYRDAVLRAHFWNGAMARAQLALITGTPTFGFSNWHALPTDFIRLRALQGGAQHRIEANKRLLSNSDTAKILYVYRVEDPAELGDLYADALATRLASAFAGHLRDEGNLARAHWDLYKEKLNEARFVDSSENSQDMMMASEFIDTARASVVGPFARVDI
jgi:hypothetical protein